MSEKNNKLGQEPAYPISEFCNTLPIGSPQQGMSKRFYAACAAINGLLANENTAKQIQAEHGSVNSEQAYKIVSFTAYKIADELLKQENYKL